MDPPQQTFTLTSFDFSSDDELNQTNKGDIDTYFELELPPPAMPEVAESDDGDKEHDFRISFSAIVPFPGFSPSSVDSAVVVSSNPSLSTCEDANTHLIPRSAIDASSATPQPLVKSTLSRIHRRPVTNHSAMSIFPLDWTRFPPPIDDNCRRPVSDINGWELVPTRKSSGPGNGGIRKLLVKLRCIVISGLGSMRASLVQAGIGTQKKLSDRWLTLCEQQQQISNNKMRSPSSVVEMKFEAVRKLFGSGVSPRKDINGNGISKSGRLNKSCPTSIKSSPAHHAGDASLVHAAIAHCKQSFGQNDDFSF